MQKKTKKVITDQELFFNKDSEADRVYVKDNLFYMYTNIGLINGFQWLSGKKKILDYGCGTGASLDLFFEKRKKEKYLIYGVDIAQKAIDRIKKKYPQFNFYKISNNKIPQIKNGTLDAAYMFHVLHHAHDHRDIFKEVNKKLDKNGKFFISDLSTNNPINKFARSLFTRMPNFVKNKFNEDLVVDGCIPEKYKVYIDRVVKQLGDTGFTVVNVEYGHLFFFVFGWIDRFIPFSKIPLVPLLYRQLISFENFLLKYTFFQKRAEVFYIKCTK